MAVHLLHPVPNLQPERTAIFMNDNNTVLFLLIGVVAVLVFLMLLIAFITFLNDFKSELRYLNNEIRRTEGRERKHYLRRRRRLWLSLLPFVKY